MAKEYIEREALLKKLSSIVVTDDFNGTMLAYGIDIATDIILKTSPAADVVEVKHGEWISDDGDVLFHCSECEAQISTIWDYESDWGYCPNCGAKMDGERKDLKGERNGDKH